MELSNRRFAIVSPNFHPRTCGVGDHSAHLARELRRRGAFAAIFSRAPVEPHPVDPGIPVYGSSGAGAAAIGRELTEAARAVRPTDVILQYTAQMWDPWRFGSTALPRLAAALKRTGARVTLVAHELYIGFAPRPDVFVASALLRVQMAAVLASCDRSFVTTDSRLKYITPYTRLLGRPDPGVLRVGPNALPVPARARGQGARVGVYSTAAVGKRFDVVLDAFATVARERPDATLLVIGDLGAPDAPRARAVRDAVSRHPAGGRISLTGKLALPEIAQRIADLDVYLFPGDTGANTRSGTLPAVLGAGIPVVAFRGPETDPAVFRDGENVALVSALDADGFARATLGLLADRDRAARIGDGGRALFERHLTWERITDLLLDESTTGLAYSPIRRPRGGASWPR